MWAKSTAFKDTIWTVGDNASGQLATGNTTNRSTPYTIDVGKGWAQVSGGSNSALAIKNNGTLWSWGGNGIGQIGDQTTANRSSPVQIGALTDWSKVSCGASYALAVKTNGTLWAWGMNGSGQLGFGTWGFERETGNLTSWTDIAAGKDSIHALRGGALWSWGTNLSGVCGIGSTTPQVSPVQVGALSTWAKVSSSTSHVAAVRTDNTLWVWGAAASGRSACCR